MSQFEDKLESVFLGEPHGFAWNFRARLLSLGKVLRMAKGKVNNDQRGSYLFNPDEGGKDLFVQQSAIQSSGFRFLKEGDKVEYDSQQGQKGP